MCLRKHTCISPKGASQVGNFWADILGIKAIVTLADKKSSAREKIGAAASIALMFMPSARISADAIGLAKSLASEAFLADAQRGIGKAIAGAGTSQALRDAPRLVSEYGGKEADWAKMASDTYKARDGSIVELHWYENKVTRQRVEYKSKI